MSVTKASTNSLTTFARYNNTLAGQTGTGTLFVAVGASSTVLTSSDGITWTARTASGTWNGIDKRFGIWNIWSYGAGATGNATSSDGITWTVAARPGAFSKMVLRDSAVAGTRHLQHDGTGVHSDSSSGFAAVGTAFKTDSTVIYNASSWNNQQIMLSVQGGAGNIFYSANGGATWTNILSSALFQVQWSFENLHIGIHSTSGLTYIYTPSGGTVTGPNTGFANNTVVVKAGSLYFMFDNGTARTNIYSSPNGVTWTSRTITSTTVGSIAFGNGVYVLVGASGNVQTSTDGATWTNRTSGTANNLNSIWFG